MLRTNNCFMCVKWVFLYCAASILLFTLVQGRHLEFLVEPENIVVFPESPAVLNCVAQLVDGDTVQPVDTSNIQWRTAYDGQPILYPGETYRSQLRNGSLYFSSVLDTETHSLTGTYRCVATVDDIGSIVSRVATVKLASLSGFEQEPRDNELFPGQTAYFTCIVHADPPATVRWLKDERPFLIDESRMLVLPSGALEIDDVQGSDQGTYRCNASGLNQYRLSNKAVLSLNEDLEKSASIAAPEFIAKPRSIIATEGETVTLDCAANGNPRPWISWLKNGVTIDLSYLDSRYKKIGTGSLQITNVEESDAGTYQCRADNREDNLDATATLEVQVPPRFLVKPQDQKEVANKDIEFECEVYGKPEPKIQWLKNGEIITPNEYWQIVNRTNLKILGLMLDDAGIFQCTGSNPAGNIQASALLSIIVKPTTTLSPKPKSTTRFTRNKSISNEFAHKLLTSLKSTDEITKPRKYDSHSLLSSLRPDAPRLLNTDESDDDDDDFLGEAEFGHSNNREYELSRRRPNLKYDPAFSFTMLKGENTDGSSLGETLSAYTENPSPSFPSILSGTIGQSSVVTDEEREVGFPSEPTDVRALIVRARFVTLSWKPPEKTNGDIISYSVGYRQEDSKRERTQYTKGSRLEEINIGGLNPDRKYFFRVTAYNNRGAGKPSQPIEVTTQSEEHVPAAPLDLNAYATSATSINVNWKEPPVTNGIIQGYKLFYMTGSTEYNKVTSELGYELTDLSMYTEYNIWVVAINQNGPGASTNEIVVRTLSSSPTAPPENVRIDVSSSSSLLVQWEPPPIQHQNGNITGYKIRYRKMNRMGGIGSGKTFPTDATMRQFMLSNLDRAATYQIRVQAVNVNGTGPWSDWITTKTYENDLDETKVPDEPSPLNTRQTAHTIMVMWDPPPNSNVKVRGYTLGWGKGIPDTYTETLDGKQRYYEIKNLEPDSEYVISLLAKNEIGNGRPVYANVRTKSEKDEAYIDTSIHQTPKLIPPVGLKAITLSATTAVLYWTDTSLSKSQYVTDGRFYIVKYTAVNSLKDRYFNATDLNCMIRDLKPFTQYEFAVKVVKGRRESDWSMVAYNTTSEAEPSSYPRDLQVLPFEDNPHMVTLKWLPPKQSNGIITGYLIQYTTDNTNKVHDWIVEGVVGDKHTTVIRKLRPSTTYYFKILARNVKGYGPYSPVVSFTSGQSNGMTSFDDGYFTKDGKAVWLFGTIWLYVIIGGSIFLVTILIIIVIVCCRRSSDLNATPDRTKKYQKALKNQNIKPPDLWIHHDQMELKAMEKSGSHGGAGSSANDGASSSGATTLPRSVGHDYDAHDCHAHASNSLDKRTYVPSYMGNKQDEVTNNRKVVKPKPITLPVDSKPPKEPIATATPINNPPAGLHHTPLTGIPSNLSDSPSVSIGPSGGLISRPAYPRTQYTISRAHVTIDQNALAAAAAAVANSPGGPASHENPYAVQQAAGSGYDTGMGLSSGNYASLPQSQVNVNVNKPIAPSGAPIGSQQHPLKSFSVPAPPPTSAPGTPAHAARQHNVTQVNVRPITSSPYKKQPIISGGGSLSHLRANPLSTIGASTSEETRPLYPSHQSDSLTRSSTGACIPEEGTRLLASSNSTEELNQEMANLEGLMKDLNAITASEFEC